jgi:uncharacterized membrane protein|uniref:STE20-related kinase adaptor alpha n=1 Tax=Mus musculus TaxID=10090 RepID=B1AR89_MOUSE
MSFLVSKPERIRVSVPSLLVFYLFFLKSVWVGITVGCFVLCDTQSSLVENKTGKVAYLMNQLVTC